MEHATVKNTQIECAILRCVIKNRAGIVSCPVFRVLPYIMAE